MPTRQKMIKAKFKKSTTKKHSLLKLLALTCTKHPTPHTPFHPLIYPHPLTTHSHRHSPLSYHTYAPNDIYSTNKLLHHIKKKVFFNSLFKHVFLSRANGLNRARKARPILNGIMIERL